MENKNSLETYPELYSPFTKQSTIQLTIKGQESSNSLCKFKQDYRLTPSPRIQQKQDFIEQISLEDGITDNQSMETNNYQKQNTNQNLYTSNHVELKLNKLKSCNRDKKNTSYFAQQQFNSGKQNTGITDQPKQVNKKKISFFLVALQTIRFIKALKKQCIDKFIVRNLSEIQINALNDVSLQKVYNSNEIEESYRSSFKNIDFLKIMCPCLIFQIPIIQPNQLFKILSDCWQSYWVLFRMYFTTIKIFFFINNMVASLSLIKIYTKYVINLSFLFDMFLSLHTGYYDNGLIVMDRRKIAIRYIKGAFITDIFAQIPLIFAYFVDQNSSETAIALAFFLDLFIFLKWFSLQNVYARLERVITENEKASLWWPLVTLLVRVLILTHLIGIMYYGVALGQKMYNPDENNTWIDNGSEPMDINDGLYWYKYLNCIYWSYSTMVSNIVFVPQTSTEIGFSMVIMMCMTGIFGYVLNTIGMILSDIERKSKQYKLEREKMNRFMKKHQISETLKERVSLYLDYIQSQEKSRNQAEENEILERMSDQLRREILYQVNGKHIHKFQYMMNTFSKQTMNDSMIILKEQLFSSKETIYKSKNNHDDDEDQKNQNDQDECKTIEKHGLFVVDKGTVQIFYQKDQSERMNVAILKPGDVFGIYEFFTGIESGIQAVSIESCSVFKIQREDFLHIIKKNNEDIQQFQMIKDQFLQFKTSIQYPLRCLLCHEQGHFPGTCPKIHNITNIKQLIYDYNHYDKQILRQNYVRDQYRTLHALMDIEFIIEAANEATDEGSSLHKFVQSLLFQNKRQDQEKNINQMNLDKSKTQFLSEIQELQQEHQIDKKETLNEISRVKKQSMSNNILLAEIRRKSLKKQTMISYTLDDKHQNNKIINLQKKKSSQDNLKFSQNSLDNKQNSMMLSKLNSQGKQFNKQSQNNENSIIQDKLFPQLQREKSIIIETPIDILDNSIKNDWVVNYLQIDKIFNWSTYFPQNNFSYLQKQNKKLFVQSQVSLNQSQNESQESQQSFFRQRHMNNTILNNTQLYSPKFKNYSTIGVDSILKQSISQNEQIVNKFNPQTPTVQQQALHLNNIKEINENQSFNSDSEKQSRNYSNFKNNKAFSNDIFQDQQQQKNFNKQNQQIDQAEQGLNNNNQNIDQNKSSYNNFSKSLSQNGNIKQQRFNLSSFNIETFQEQPFKSNQNQINKSNQQIDLDNKQKAQQFLNQYTNKQ